MVNIMASSARKRAPSDPINTFDAAWRNLLDEATRADFVEVKANARRSLLDLREAILAADRGRLSMSVIRIQLFTARLAAPIPPVEIRSDTHDGIVVDVLLVRAIDGANVMFPLAARQGDTPPILPRWSRAAVKRGAAVLTAWTRWVDSRDENALMGLQLSDAAEPLAKLMLANEAILVLAGQPMPAKSNQKTAVASGFVPNETQSCIIQALKENHIAMNVPEISKLSGMSEATCKRILPALEKTGIVHRPHGRKSGFALKHG